MIEITVEQAENIKQRQEKFFYAGRTKDADFRIRQLKRLKCGIKKYEKELLLALKQDLGKCEAEGYMTEVGYVYKSIDDHVQHLRQWIQPKRVKTPFYMMPAKSYRVAEPYGRVLIIGPFNYPFQLVLEPMIGAIAAGNCVVVKLSELTPVVSEVVRKLLEELFPKKYVWCVEGGIPTTTVLLNQQFDYIFFTGSPVVGRIVMEAAAKHMTPVTLELGGKSPVIIDQTANLKTAATRIIWGKTVNAGQTCVAPDYVYVHESVKDAFVEAMKEAYRKFYGASPKDSSSYARIVNKRHYQRLERILTEEAPHVIFGGEHNEEDRFVGLTLIEVSSWNQASMREEIFGPILPILTYTEIQDVIDQIISQPKPLALYVFSQDERFQKHVLHHTTSGGVCINDVISHVANPFLPFGGVGNSGIGSYHSKESFYTFSHRKSIYHNLGSVSNLLSAPPYRSWKQALVRLVFH